jgi:hypothetical protein
MGRQVKVLPIAMDQALIGHGNSEVEDEAIIPIALHIAESAISNRRYYIMSRMIKIRVPATSANLGPGFDCLGLALDIWNEITFEPAERTTYRVKARARRNSTKVRGIY